MEKVLGYIYEKDKNLARSFRVLYFLSGILMLILGLINLGVFGLEGGRYPELGSALGFMGVSWFFISGLFPLLLGLGLVSYAILSYKKLIFDTSETSIEIYEKYLFRQSKISINPEELTGISYNNLIQGRRYLWIVLFVPYILYVWDHGWGYYAYYVKYFQGFPTAGVLLCFSAVFMSFILLIILLSTPINLTLYLRDGKYETDVEIYLVFALKQYIIPKFNRYFKNGNVSPSKEPRTVHAPMNFTAVISGVLLVFIFLQQLTIIESTWSFIDDFTVYIGIAVGLMVLIDGLCMMTYSYINDHPTTYPIMVNEFMWFASYITTPIVFKQEIKKNYALKMTKITKFGLYLLLFNIGLSTSRVIKGVIYETDLWWRGLISTFIGIIFILIIFRLLLERRRAFVYQFLNKELSFLVYPKFRSFRHVISYYLKGFNFIKIEKRNRTDINRMDWLILVVILIAGLIIS